MECEDRELSILITDDQEISELNSQYRNKPRPTDVLSFSQSENGVAGEILGDVVISLETAERQAENEKVSEEIIRLLIHGVLHLLGYDHEDVSAEERAAMRGKEEELFREICRQIY